MSGALRRLGLLLTLAIPTHVAAEAPVEALFHRGLAPVTLGATPEADQSASACADCHAAIAAEWAASRHAQAWTNGIFQREFRDRPLDWCVRCHAPLAPGSAASVDAVSAEGVSCAVCHLRDGAVLAASRREGSPHTTRVIPGFDTEALCAGCHQFAFPFIEADGAVTRYTDHPMQDTVAEFLAGPHRDRTGACLGCHGRTPAGHRFPGAHEPAALQHAAELQICRSGRARLRLGVRNAGAGHHLPTGDLHRHLVLRAWRSSDPTALWEASIGRAFEPAPDAGKVVRVDTSIAPLETRSWEIRADRLGGARDEPVNVELRYVYTADEIPSAQNDPGEPTSVAVYSRRLDSLQEVPRCP